MKQAAKVLIVLLILGITTALHELGHAFAMRSSGLELRGVAIGILVPHMTKDFKIPALFGSATISASPLIFGAGVAVDAQALRSLSRERQATIFGAGVILNVALAIVFYALYCALMGSWVGTGISATVLFAIIAANAAFSSIIALYVIPIAGLIALIGFSIAFAQRKLENDGPIAGVRVGVELALTKEAPLYAAVISFMIGAGNMIPMLPLDGGRIAGLWFQEWNWSVSHIDTWNTIVAGWMIVTTVLLVGGDIRAWRKGQKPTVDAE